jgi:hypothetical protein
VRACVCVCVSVCLCKVGEGIQSLHESIHLQEQRRAAELDGCHVWPSRGGGGCRRGRRAERGSGHQKGGEGEGGGGGGDQGDGDGSAGRAGNEQCVRACVLACVRMCVCVRARARVCVCLCVCVCKIHTTYIRHVASIHSLARADSLSAQMDGAREREIHTREKR